MNESTRLKKQEERPNWWFNDLILTDAQQSVEGSAQMSLLILVSIFTCAASLMYLVYRNFPELSMWVLFAIKIFDFISNNNYQKNIWL